MNIEQILQEVEQGDLNALEAYIDLKLFKSKLDNAIKQIEEDAIVEADKYNEKTFETHNARVTMNNGRRIWSFDHSRKWKAVKSNLKSIEEDMKQMYLASEKIGGESLITQDGEELEMAQCKYTDATLSIKPLQL